MLSALLAGKALENTNYDSSSNTCFHFFFPSSFALLSRGVHGLGDFPGENRRWGAQCLLDHLLPASTFTSIPRTPHLFSLYIMLFFFSFLPKGFSSPFSPSPLINPSFPPFIMGQAVKTYLGMLLTQSPFQWLNISCLIHVAENTQYGEHPRCLTFFLWMQEL